MNQRAIAKGWVFVGSRVRNDPTFKALSNSLSGKMGIFLQPAVMLMPRTICSVGGMDDDEV